MPVSFRTRVDEVSVISRYGQGVRLIRLDEGLKLVSVQRVVKTDDEEQDGQIPADVDADGVADAASDGESVADAASDAPDASDI